MEENKEKGRKKEPISWPAGPQETSPGCCGRFARAPGCRDRVQEPGGRRLSPAHAPLSATQPTAGEAEPPPGLRMRGCARPRLAWESEEGLEPPVSRAAKSGVQARPAAGTWGQGLEELVLAESSGGPACGRVKKTGFWGTGPQGWPDRRLGEPTVGSAPVSEVSPGGPRGVEVSPKPAQCCRVGCTRWWVHPACSGDHRSPSSQCPRGPWGQAQGRVS